MHKGRGMRYSRKIKTRINMNVGKDIKLKKIPSAYKQGKKPPAVALLYFLVYSENWKNLLVKKS